MSDLKIVYDASEEASEILTHVEKYLNCDEQLDKDAVINLINSKMTEAFEKGRNFQMLVDEGRRNLQTRSLSIDDGLTEGTKK